MPTREASISSIAAATSAFVGVVVPVVRGEHGVLGHRDGVVVVDRPGRVAVVGLQRQDEVELDVDALADRGLLDLQAGDPVAREDDALVVDGHGHGLVVLVRGRHKGL